MQLSDGSGTDNILSYPCNLYIYTDDGIVDKLNINSWNGGTFTTYCNPWGVTNTGNWTIDRKSMDSWPSAGDLPQYKIFLNNPDSSVFPTGELGQICDVSTHSDCDGTIDILIKVTKPGSITIDIDCPPTGAGPEDITLSSSVTGSADCSVYDTIHWNGINGLGVAVQNGASVDMNIDYLNGLTNLPLWDIEDASQGIKVDIVRPAPSSGSTILPIYWDDTNLGGGSNLITGCVYPSSPTVSGCHNFPPNPPQHDQMVNSWWYYLTQASVIQSLAIIRTPPTPATPTGA